MFGLRLTNQPGLYAPGWHALQAFPAHAPGSFFLPGGQNRLTPPMRPQADAARAALPRRGAGRAAAHSVVAAGPGARCEGRTGTGWPGWLGQPESVRLMRITEPDGAVPLQCGESPGLRSASLQPARICGPDPGHALHGFCDPLFGAGDGGGYGGKALS